MVNLYRKIKMAKFFNKNMKLMNLFYLMTFFKILTTLYFAEIKENLCYLNLLSATVVYLYC